MNLLIIFLVVLVAIILFASINILKEYERGVVFTLGRFTSVKGPGLVLIMPIVQQVQRMQKHYLMKH